MKARLLRKLLNDTQYTISNHDDYIAIGSSMCHDLISVDKKTLKVKFALDTFNEGRKAIKHSELEFIWDKLHELIASGEIQDIITGRDAIENPLPVFTVKDGKVIESVTDAYGWPNTDDNGVLMYENTHFETKREALEYGIREYTSAEEYTITVLEELHRKVSDVQVKLFRYNSYLNDLRAQLEQEGK